MFKYLCLFYTHFTIAYMPRDWHKYTQRCFAGGNASPRLGLASVYDRGVLGATWLPEQSGIP